MKKPASKETLWFFGALGRIAAQLLESLIDIFGLFYRLISASGPQLANYRLLGREFIRQVYYIGVCGWPMVALTGLLLGLAIIVYAAAQLARIQGELLIGNLLVIIVVRELGPVFTALLVLLRSGAAIIVEIGAMALDREMDAMELMGVEPEIFIGVPRFWGLIISLIILYFIFLISAILGGYLFGQLFTEIYWQGLWLSFVGALTWQDLFISAAKILLFGMSIGAVAIYYGFRVKEHLSAVAQHISRGAVVSLLFLGVINAVLSILGYS